MAYPIMCILPVNRALHFENDILVSLSDTLMENFLKEEGSNYITDSLLFAKDKTGIKLCHQNSSISHQSLNDIGTTFGFTYASRLLFLHESNLRNYSLWGLDPTLEENNDASIVLTANKFGIADKLARGECHSNLYIKHIPDIGDTKIGYGLFTDVSIDEDVMIGEYVGIILTSMPEPTGYSLYYPCCDGNYEINASEYGNLTRFINSTSVPNCAFKPVLFEGIIHIVCVSFFDNFIHKFFADPLCLDWHTVIHDMSLE
jgi:hypothetical protein